MKYALFALSILSLGVTSPAKAEEPRETGQSAFAAIAEITEILSRDPTTDWRQVDLDALRAHLVDMDTLTLRAKVESTPTTRGVLHHVTGEGETVGAIQRMTTAHAHATRHVFDTRIEHSPSGVAIELTGRDEAEIARLRGLGFFGFMATGGHHQPHHLALARGEAPHH